MMKKSPNNNPPDSPPWAVVITALVLTLVSAWLVFGRGWDPWKAFSVVSLAALGIILLLLTALLIWSGPEERAGVWQQVLHTCREDIDLLLKFFRIRR
jgi:hypothetical protein